jgi:hypothetical protein
LATEELPDEKYFDLGDNWSNPVHLQKGRSSSKKEEVKYSSNAPPFLIGLVG